MGLTLVEKILQNHLSESSINISNIKRGEDYIELHPDRVIMQDATAQMAMLQFIQSRLNRVAVPASIHCDHLIQAQYGMKDDLICACKDNVEVYNFLKSAADKFGIDFWGPGSGIIHQIVFENYIEPGGLVIGTDSHTPTGGGLCALCIGVGGADAVDVLTGQSWQLKMPRIININLEGRLQGYASAKDIILYILGILGADGGTNYVLEYSGSGCQTLTATDKATICNMGAECGATTSIFPTDDKTYTYLGSVGRIDRYNELKADVDAIYDKVININLSNIEPMISLPGNPADTVNLLNFIDKRKSSDNNIIETVLIGSCTNSSLDDIRICAEIADYAMKNNISLKTELIILPGSLTVYSEAYRCGYIQTLRYFGAKIMACSCGPCIGQWKRFRISKGPNNILTTFNRNFTARNDGDLNTSAYIVSPITAMRFALTGVLCDIDNNVKYKERDKYTLDINREEFSEPTFNSKISIDNNSERLQLLVPWEPWSGEDLRLHILKKIEGQCTTDHISPAGKWLRYRGHLGNISQNFLLGKNKIEDKETPYQKAKRLDTDLCIIGDKNYGEGSSREHAALEARYLGVKVVIAKSFARIHETNLKKQGILALTFEDEHLYDFIVEEDIITIYVRDRHNNRIPFMIEKNDGSKFEGFLKDTYNDKQWEWFVKGSALNTLIDRYE